VLYDATVDVARVRALCQNLVDRRMIVAQGDAYSVSPEQITGLVQREELLLVAADLARVALPMNETISPITAENLFREGSELRQKDFAGSALHYLQAARVQLEALRSGHSRSGFDDLKWYLASYCSVKAGHAFVSGDFDDAIPYYLAFFSLAQEADCVWPRIQRLVGPMSSYFFAIAGKQLDESVPSNLGRSLACQVALLIYNHPNPRVGENWMSLIERLADVNLGIIRQLQHDLRSLMRPMAGGNLGVESLARAEQTRAYLADLVARRERPEEAATQEQAILAL
jgi:hypothetical protein